MRHLVVDVQILIIASGMSDPPDDGSGLTLLKSVRDTPAGRLVWDAGGLIKAQYEKLNEQSFARQWLEELVLANKIVSVKRHSLTKKQSLCIRETGLVGEDLQYYVRTAASSPDRKLVSHDQHYDDQSCRELRRQLDVKVYTASEGSDFIAETG